MENVINWKKGDPVPIYFNLSNSHFIKKQWDQSEFKSIFSFNQIAQARVRLFLDSFDESGQKTNLIDTYLG